MLQIKCKNLKSPWPNNILISWLLFAKSIFLSSIIPMKFDLSNGLLVWGIFPSFLFWKTWVNSSKLAQRPCHITIFLLVTLSFLCKVQTWKLECYALLFVHEITEKILHGKIKLLMQWKYNRLASGCIMHWLIGLQKKSAKSL